MAELRIGSLVDWVCTPYSHDFFSSCHPLKWHLMEEVLGAQLRAILSYATKNIGIYLRDGGDVAFYKYKESLCNQYWEIARMDCPTLEKEQDRIRQKINELLSDPRALTIPGAISQGVVMEPPGGGGCSLPPFDPGWLERKPPVQPSVPSTSGGNKAGQPSEQPQPGSAGLTEEELRETEPSTPSLGGPSKTADDSADFNEIDTEGMTPEEIAALKEGMDTGTNGPVDMLPGETPEDAVSRVLSEQDALMKSEAFQKMTTQERLACESDTWNRIHDIQRKQLQDAPGQEIQEESEDGHEVSKVQLLPDGTIHSVTQRVSGGSERQVTENWVYLDGTQVTRQTTESRGTGSGDGAGTEYREQSLEILSPDRSTCKVFSSSASETKSPPTPLSPTGAPARLLSMDEIQAEIDALKKTYSSVPEDVN